MVQRLSKQLTNFVNTPRIKRLTWLLVRKHGALSLVAQLHVNYKLGSHQHEKGQASRKAISATYDLEYGEATLQMEADSIKPGQRVLVVDDLLATGGTISATIKMIEELGGIVVGCAFLIELKDLHGREKIKDYDMKALMEF